MKIYKRYRNTSFERLGREEGEGRTEEKIGRDSEVKYTFQYSQDHTDLKSLLRGPSIASPDGSLHQRRRGQSPRGAIGPAFAYNLEHTKTGLKEIPMGSGHFEL